MRLKWLAGDARALVGELIDLNLVINEREGKQMRSKHDF